MDLMAQVLAEVAAAEAGPVDLAPPTLVAAHALTDGAAGAVGVPPADPAPVLLAEVIDETVELTDGEVREAAEWLGMDPVLDFDLLWIAKKFLLAPLPRPWAPYQGRTHDEIFYFNSQTGESTWHHPCDDLFKKLYETEKIKKAPVKVVTVFIASYADDDEVKVTCTGMSGDILATLFRDENQTFGGLKAMLAQILQVDNDRLRLVLQNAKVPGKHDLLVSFSR